MVELVGGGSVINGAYPVYFFKKWGYWIEGLLSTGPTLSSCSTSYDNFFPQYLLLYLQSTWLHLMPKSSIKKHQKMCFCKEEKKLLAEGKNPLE